MAYSRERAPGKWEIRVSNGRNIHGKNIEYSRTWIAPKGLTGKKLEKELSMQMIKFEEEVKKGNYSDGKIRFYDFAKQWLKDYGEKNLAPATYARYEQFLTRINLAIGHIKLKDITPTHLIRFYSNLEEDGINQKTNGKLAPKTILEHHRLISSILKTAVKWKYIEENVARSVDPPKVPRIERKYLDDMQIMKMLVFLDGEPIQYKTMINILVYTGMRRGELCGLEWKDIDLDNQRINIVRTSQRVKGKKITKGTKTHSSTRSFALCPTVCNMIKEYKKWYDEQKIKAGDCWTETDRLFIQWNGSPIHPDTITGWFAKFISKSDLPYVTLHSLRHTNATLMIAEGADVCTVSKRLGHANTATTLNIYSHALSSKDIEAAEKLESALSIS